ncbi:MAG: N-acetyltransferase, partial [Geminicoccaceae bacterium]
MPPVRIEPVTGARGLKEFLALPFRLYAHDTSWVPPLMLERRQHLDPRRNPFFARAEVAYWLARRDGESVGRISAQVNRAHLERHRDATGHFGFLEAEDDPETFAALFEAAEAWLRARGLARCVGPFSLSINDESGLLVEGFESPPYIMMGHALPYYGARVEEQGYVKAKDLIAYLLDTTAELPARATRLFDKLGRTSGLRFRHLEMARFDEEVRTIVDIFNDAWADNWGFVPFSDEEMRHLGKSLKPLLREEYVAIGEIDGVPA